SFDEHKFTIGVFLDFSKAFDKLRFSSIRSSLFKLNLPFQLNMFIEEFLKCRQQRVSYNGQYSSYVKVLSGVPQGSVLGPILFALVIDSLTPLCDNSLMFKYADDVTILHCIRSISEDHLQNEWDHLESWSASQGLFLNFEKSFVMNCITKKSLQLFPILTCDGKTIQNVSSLRILGVTISSDLSWNEHFSSTASKCFKRFFILRNLKRANCPPELLYKCYVAFIQSVMLYSFPSLCNAPKYLLNKFLRVERRACKFFQLNDFPSFITVADKMCARLFQNVLRNEDHSLRCMFVARTPTLRNSMLLQPPFARTARFGNSFIRYAKDP
ncbi:MAG: reverse transcriptase domain-containing protein, partial [Pseudomonadota bacterium]